MSDRLLGAVRALVRAELSRLSYLGTYAYTVQRAAAGTVDAAPASALPLPPLVGVPLASSLLGQRVTPAAAGAPCRIRFVNGDPSRPVCVGIGAVPVRASVDATDTLRLGPSASAVALAGGSAALARVGDSCTFFLPPTAIATGTVTPPTGPTFPLTGTLAILNGMSGLVAAGSRTVRSA